MKSFSTYNYTPLLNLRRTDFINLKSTQKLYIPFGDDNLLPSQLTQLSREVPVHRAILNCKTSYVVGKGIVSDHPVIQSLLSDPNNTYEDFNTILHRLVFDYLVIGNSYLEIITNTQKTFSYFFHIDASKCRLASETNDVLIHPSWEEFKGKGDPNITTIPLFPSFAKGADGLLHSVYHIKDYEPEFYYYGLCSYFAGMRPILISGLTNLWNQNRLERGFTSPGLLVVGGINDTADADALDAELSKFNGVDGEKSGNMVIQYLADLSPGQQSQAAEFIEFKKNEEGNWTALHDQAELSIITIHNWFRSLTPYANETTGFDSNRIANEYEIALNTVIRPLQEFFARHFDQVFTHFNLPAGQLQFLNESPVERINPFKFVWEARQDSGLPFDPNDPLQKQLVIQVRNTFNSNNKSETTRV